MFCGNVFRGNCRINTSVFIYLPTRADSAQHCGNGVLELFIFFGSSFFLLNRLFAKLLGGMLNCGNLFTSNWFYIMDFSVCITYINKTNSIFGMTGSFILFHETISESFLCKQQELYVVGCIGKKIWRKWRK